MTKLAFRTTTIIIALLGMLFVSLPAQAATGDNTANYSGITSGYGEDEGVIGQPLEDVFDEPDVTPVVKMSWPKGRDRIVVSVTVDNRLGSKTYKSEIRTVLFASNDVFSAPSEATEELVGVDRKVKVKAGTTKTYKLFTYQSTTSRSAEADGASIVGTVTRAKGAKMTDLIGHQRIKKAKGIALDSVIRMEAWPTTPNGSDITNVMCPAWFMHPSLWGSACYM